MRRRGAFAMRFVEKVLDRRTGVQGSVSVKKEWAQAPGHPVGVVAGSEEVLRPALNVFG